MLNFLQKHKIDDDVFAAGVSGGADSLALVLLMNECLKPLGKKVTALTVNHGLRPEADEEAAYVRQVMVREGIEHHILVWEGEKPVTGIEEAARTARYKLLGDWCRDNGVRCLCVAHHALDQAETFLMRLQRGSGLTGLCGMQEVSNLNGLTILRPLLSTNPEDLKNYLRQKNIKWVTDSSNSCEDFLRVQVRRFLPEMEKAVGISPQRLIDTMSVLNRSRDYIQMQVDKFIRSHVRFWDGAGVSLSLQMLSEQHEEIVYRVLAALIKQTGQRDYTARAEDIERLATALRQDDFHGATLGHCEIFIHQSKLWIVPELRLKTKMPKTVWEKFTTAYPQYTKMKLPYKLRAALVKTKMDIEF